MILFKALLVQSVADAHVVGGEVQHGVQWCWESKSMEPSDLCPDCNTSLVLELVLHTCLMCRITLFTQWQTVNE